MAEAKNTTLLLKQLRGLMQNVAHVKQPISAYIVPSKDAHYSEYLADCDKRRAFISGFTGSEGTAIVTQEHACMWTDGRYFIQAAEEMDSNWTLMKEGMLTTPSQAVWLSKNLASGSKVGVDPRLYSYDSWVPLQAQLDHADIELVAVDDNLIDLIWPDKPKRPSQPLQRLPLQYTGRTILSKAEAVRDAMREKNAKYHVVTALDQIAWFLNLRGSDIPFNPVFFSYLLIGTDSIVLFVDAARWTDELAEHVRAELNGQRFAVEPYETVVEHLKATAKEMDAGHIWLADTASYSLTSLVPHKRLLVEPSPIELMKAVKNDVEIAGMRNAHVKDGAALCCYFAWLEEQLADQKTVTEISGAAKLTDFRRMQRDFVGPSFETISSVGEHGAIIHYAPTPRTDRPINTRELYLCDSGGQYKDGTTDVTRTLHFGDAPTAYQRECFTRVLQGQFRMGTATFPRKTIGNRLDSFARQSLWSIGLDYAHGTGHGVGAYLNVHEGPIEISWRTKHKDPGLEAGMFVSNEPGYYEDGQFGIRLEDVVQVVEARTPHNFNGRGFLTFETVTYCPIQTKMLVPALMTDEEIAYVNAYHSKCRDVLGKLLDEQGQLAAKKWLWKETEPIAK